MSFIRRFSAIPSLAVLLAVSGVVIVDAPPPRPVNASPFGKILVVGEFEDGEFNTPTDLLTSSDQASKFGLFGFTYGSQKYRYPCAKASHRWWLPAGKIGLLPPIRSRSPLCTILAHGPSSCRPRRSTLNPMGRFCGLPR